MGRGVSKPVTAEGDPWRRPMFRGDSDDHFAYAGWDDPIHEVHELVERGVHGRGLTDDGPVPVAEHKRLEGQQKRDLVIHQRSTEYDERSKRNGYRQRRGPTLTAEEREERRRARREQKMVEELKALGYIVFKMEK